jgi:hypothetical protein
MNLHRKACTRWYGTDIWCCRQSQLCTCAGAAVAQQRAGAATASSDVQRALILILMATAVVGLSARLPVL